MFTERGFGVEIEAYGLPMHKVAEALVSAGISCYTEQYNHQTRRHWKVVSDASLVDENHHTLRNAFELVSPPLHGEAGLSDLRKAMAAIETAGAIIHKACGLHVHVETRDFTVQDARVMAERYARFESIIDSFMPPSRRNSQWCQPTRRILDEINWQVPTNLAQLADLIGVHRRYFKVNMHAYARTHATIEFRQHSGTVNGVKAANWVRFLIEFAEESKRVSRAMNGQTTQPVTAAVLEARERLAREGTLINAIIEGLLQPNGAGIQYLMALTNWQRHTVRGAISEQLRTQRGLNVLSRRQRDGNTRYWIPADRPLRNMAQPMAPNPTLTAAPFPHNRTAMVTLFTTTPVSNGFRLPSEDSLWNGIDPVLETYFRNRAETIAAR